MQPQVAHESEVHRQHVRLKIPIEAEIDGQRFVVDDWSMGGFGVESEITSRQPGEKFQAVLRFPFEDFDLSLKLDCELVYILDDQKRFGCKFSSVSQGQLGLFRFLVDSYLSGEVVTGGDVLAIVQREGAAEARAPQGVYDPWAAQETAGAKLKRALGWLFLLAVAGGLAALVGFGAYDKFLVTKAERAVIETPLFTLRSPVDGVVLQGQVGDILNPGDPVATVTERNGQLAQLVSPCFCVLLDWRLQNGELALPGAEIAILASADEPLLVRAEVPFENALALNVGDRAIVEIPGRPDAYEGEIDKIDLKPRLGAGGAERRTVRVVVRPDRPFEFEDLGSLVSVRFL